MDSPMHYRCRILLSRVQLFFYLAFILLVSLEQQTDAFRNRMPVAVMKLSHGKARFHQSLNRKMATLEYSKDRSWNLKSSTEIDLLFDSDCPICRMEVEFLRKRDIYNRIQFTDLQSPEYDPKEHGDVSFEKGMRKLRAVLPDRTVVTGVEVFRRTYEAIGLGWVFYLTQFPVIGEFADSIYDFWAEHRLRITGRGDLADMVRAKADELREAGQVDECDLDSCEIDWDE